MPSAIAANGIAIPPVPRFLVNIIYASETGTAQEFGEHLHLLLRPHGRVTLACASSIDLSKLSALAQENATVLLIAATAGEGEAPRTFRDLWTQLRLRSLSATTLSGLHVAVLGLGDAAYEKYNAVARRLRSRLADLGASPLFDAILADGSSPAGLETAFERFTQQAADALGIPPDEWQRSRRAEVTPRAILQVGNEPGLERLAPVDAWLPGEARDMKSKGEWTYGRLTENYVLTDARHLDDDREVRHLRFDVSSAPNESLLRNLHPGDVLHILPRNSATAVDTLLALTGWDGSRCVRLVGGSAGHLPVRPGCRLDSFLAGAVGLSAPVRRRFLERLAPFATDPRERARLFELSTPVGADAFEAYAAAEKRSPLLILRDFPSARPPLSDLVDMLPPLRARAYSVAGIPHCGKAVELCAAIERFVVATKLPRVGVASAHFVRAKIGDIIPMRAETGPRPRCGRPTVLVAAGAGAAFIRPIAAQGNEGLLVFYGCRTPDADFLYKDEWIALQDSGRAAILCAFSRLGPRKVYVQDKLKEKKELVWHWIANRKAYVYVSGKAGAFPRAVRCALREMAEEVGGYSMEQAGAFVRRMESSRQLIIECW